MLSKMAATFGALLAGAWFSPAVAQQYQSYRAPLVSNLTGGGIAPVDQGVGGGTTQPPESSYGGGYAIPSGGGMAASTESVGGGVSDTPYSSYGSGYGAGLSGGGTTSVGQGSTNSGGLAVAPNGETYKALGITGY